MFVYHYRRYFVPDQEEYDSLAELFERAWSDMEYENAYPDCVTVGDTVLIPQSELVDLVLYNVPSDLGALRSYFADTAARYAHNNSSAA